MFLPLGSERSQPPTFFLPGHLPSLSSPIPGHSLCHSTFSPHSFCKKLQEDCERLEVVPYIYSLSSPFPSSDPDTAESSKCQRTTRFPCPPRPAQPCLDVPATPVDPECSELIPGEDLGRVRAGHRLTHLAGRDPGPGVLVTPQDDLDHARRVLGPRGQGHTGVIVGSHSHVEMGEVLWPLHILELILVGCGDMDSLWTEGRREGIVGAPRKLGPWGTCLTVAGPAAAGSMAAGLMTALPIAQQR